MDFEELLKVRSDIGKLSKVLDGASAPETSLYTSNLMALVENSWRAQCWFLDRLIAETIGLRETRLDGESAQQALDLVPEGKAASAAKIREVVRAFLESQRLETDDSGKVLEGSSEAEEDPREEEEGAGAPEEAPTGEDVRDVLMRVQTERAFPPAEVLDLWTQEERISARDWAEAKLEGADPPPPECVSRVNLEDLSSGDAGDRVIVLSWVGVEVASDVEWSQELWDEVFEWAVSAHRVDRGESDVDVPEFPAIFMPDAKPSQVKAFVSESRGTATPEGAVEYFAGHSVDLVILALLALGEITTDGEHLSADGEEMESTNQAALDLVKQIAQREVLVAVSNSGDVTVSSTLREGEESSADELPDGSSAEEDPSADGAETD